ncbi:MAG: helix-turn-helix transcriptional regulator [Solobacterium sp.]|nr:helix-turn-helix transcriptional regulator [Solobacterium sp.]
MNELGNKIAAKRRDLGMTQTDFADRLSVTRQTVSRWEAGTVLPDIDKISDIASILGVSCDYLLKDEIMQEKSTAAGVSRLLLEAKGRRVKLQFFEDEADIDLYDVVCRIVDFEGNWMKVQAETKKGPLEKVISLSAVRSLEFAGEDE